MVNNVHVDGVAATGGVGSLTVNAKANIVPELNAMTGLVGDVLVWGLVDEDQTPSYSPVDESQSPSYTTVTDTQSPDWDEVAA